jgi:hypothetical protein
LPDGGLGTARLMGPQTPRARRRAGDLVIALTRAGRGGSGRIVGWAAQRGVASNSVTALSLLLALCGAAWLSGGTEADCLRGFAAVCGWAGARVCARRLNAVAVPRTRPAGQAKASLTESDRTDWLILPGFDWPGADRHRPPGTIPVTKPRAGERSFAWLSEVATVAAECAIYGGITAGGQAAGWTGTWPLAIVAVVVISVAEIAGTCVRAKATTAGQARRMPKIFGTVGAALLPPPVALRVLTATLITIRYGPRIALFAVLAVEVVALARALVSLADRRQDRDPGRPEGSTLAAFSEGQEILLACRDDGPVARLAGRLVQGNLAPMPPALLGVLAIVLLTMLGLRHLPGVIGLAPVVVLLLATPGASHPHDGRFDWLVPVLLCLAQYSYLVALGLAKSVPGLAVFSAVAMVAVWYASLVASPMARSSARSDVLSSRRERVDRIVSRRADGLGWEVRVGLVGLTGIFGFAVFGYLGLAAYLAILLCRKAVIGYLLPPDDEPEREDRRQ